MAFDRNYDALIAHAANVAQYEGGYLDSEGQKEATQARTAYAAERNKTAYDILAEKPDLELVYDRIRGDLASIAEENEAIEGLCTFVAEDLIEKLEEESAKSGTLRMVKRYAGPAILGALGIAYAAIFFINDLTVDEPFESKGGLVQHAAAYEKFRTHDDWMSTRARRGGAIKGLLLWPWEPDDEEMQAAEVFAGNSLSLLATLTENGGTCSTQGLLSNGEFLSEQQMGFVDDVAEFVLDEGTEWQDPPVMTPAAYMLGRFGCAELPEAAPAGAVPGAAQ
ncbi:MAG: hypothetical protein WBA51_00210 [Erythrobacter sp.]